jgi:hypothetical protein
MSMKRLSAMSSIAVAVLCSAWGTSRAPESEATSLVFIDGTDTAGRESFIRTDNAVKGDLFLGTKHFHYEGQVTPTGSIARFDVRTSGGNSGSSGDAGGRLTSLIVGRDSAQFIDRLGGNADTLRVASPRGALPLINPSIGTIEFIIQAARAQKTPTATVPILSIDELGVGALDVTFVAPDSAMIGVANAATKPLHVLLDARGHVRGGTLGARRIMILPAYVPLPSGK